MKSAIGYIRVSTESQANDGVSLEVQRVKILAWCELNDYALTHIFIESGISGSRADNRPELQKTLEASVKSNALIVYSLSRLARSTTDTLNIAHMLQKKNVDLVSLSERIDTTTAAGKMVFRMLAVLSEFERDQISERTTAAMRHKKSIGERVGSIPYGFQLANDNVTLKLDQTEQKILTVVQKLRTKGFTLRAIATNLTTNGYQPRGQRWHPQTISNIIRAAPPQT